MDSPIIQLHDLSFQMMISEAEIKKTVKALAQDLEARYAGKRPVFLPILNGSYIFAADLTREMNIELETSFIKLSSYKGTKSTGDLSQLIGLQESLTGRPVIIIEDIIDTGRTLNRLIPELQSLNPESIEVIALLFKPEALQAELNAKYLVGFEIPNKFVVGYGLDYNGLGRNVKDIYQLVEE